MNMTLREAFDAVLAEVRAAENNAIDTNKPTLFAYFGEVGDKFAALATKGYQGLYDVVDNQIVNRRSETEAEMLERVLRAAVAEANESAARFERYAHEHPGKTFTYDHDRTNMAQLWALSIYAEKALRLAGFRLEKRSLDWLRVQKRWPVAENSRAA